jgi:iron complex outermembrane receptor protein
MFACGALAQSSPPQDRTTHSPAEQVTQAQLTAQAGDAARMALPAVVVTATRSPAAALALPASVSVVREDELARRNVVRLGDALADVPGLYLRGAAFGAGFPGSGQAVLSLRGIPRTPRTLVMIDGQPINNALSGGINVAGIPFDSIERAEIVRGPYSAMYGGNAMGGVINFITAGPDKPLTEARAGAGTLQQRRISLLHRHRYESGLGLTMSLGYRDSDGYPNGEYVVKQPGAGAPGAAVTGARPTTTPDGTPAYWVGVKGRRPWSQEEAQMTLHYSPGAATQLAAGFGWTEYRVGYTSPETFLRNAAGAPVLAGAVGFIDGAARRLAVSESDFLTATPSHERDLRLYARMTHQFGTDTELRVNLGTLRHRFDFSQPASGVSAFDSGAGDYVAQPNERTDLDVSLRAWMSPEWALVGGASLNRSTLDRRTVSLASWRNADTGTALLNAGCGSVRNTALFVQSEHHYANGVTAYLGGRYDRFDTEGEVIQNTAPAFSQTYGSRVFHQLSPKLALVWQARPSLSLRTSYGAGFRPPALLDLYSRTALPSATAGTVSINEPAPELEAERVRSLEFGADAMLPGGGTASATVYTQQLRDLIYRRRLSATLTRTENAGAAQVDGIEASLHQPVGLPGLRFFGALTHQFRYEITRNDAVPASVGKLLTDVPRTTYSLGLEFDRLSWSGLLVYRQVGRVFGSGDDLNLNTVQGVFGSYDRYAIINAKVGYRFDRHLSASLALDNLGNQRYFAFNRQAGRTLYGELAYRF